MKKYVLIIAIISCQNLFSQTGGQKNVDTSRIYLKITSTQYKPVVGNVYISGGLQNVYVQTLNIPYTAFMPYRCDSVKPCKVNIDGTNFDSKLNLLLAGWQFYKGDSIILNMDTQTVTVINRNPVK